MSMYTQHNSPVKSMSSVKSHNMQKKKKTYTFISCIFALNFVAQIVFAQKKISCGKPSDFRLIEEGEFDMLTESIKKTRLFHIYSTSFIQLIFRQEKLLYKLNDMLLHHIIIYS